MKEADYALLDKQVKILANSLSDFCKTTCKAHCCRVGSLLLDAQQAQQFTQKKKREDGLFIVHLQKRGCEFLSSTGTCTSYATRPNLCQEFPLFLKGKSLLVANWCPGVKEGLLLPKIMKLKEEFPEVKIITI